MPSLLLLCVLIFGIGLASGGFPVAGFWWDFLVAMGFSGTAIIAFLGWDSESPASNPRLRLHRNLAVLAATLITLHTFGYLLLDSTLLEYLKPTAPAYMLAGIAAFCALLIVTISAFPTPRRQIYGSFPVFRSWHRILFGIVLAGTVWHLLGTDFSLGEYWQAGAAIVVLCVAPLAAYAARRGRIRAPLTRPPQSNASADRATAIGSVLLILGSFGFAGIKQLACTGC